MRHPMLAAPLLLSAALAGAAPEPAPSPRARLAGSITVSRETTHLVAPLKADGTPDYAAALNLSHGRGVTPETNAALPLLQAVGPRDLSDAAWAGILERVGLPEDAVGRQHLTPVGGLYADVLRAMEGPWREADLPAVAAWLNANDNPLALVKDASRRSRLWIPWPEGGSLTRAEAMSPTPYREAARALVARAMRRLGAGDGPGAASDLVAVVRLGNLFGQGSHLGESVFGSELRSLGAERLPVVASRLTGAQARATLAELREAEAFPSPLERLSRGERYVVLDFAIRLAQEGERKGPSAWRVLLEPTGAEVKVPAGLYSVPPEKVDWDAVLEDINRWHDRNAAALRKPLGHARSEALAALRRDFSWMHAAEDVLREPELGRALRQPGKDPRLSQAFASVIARVARTPGEGRALLPWYEAGAAFRLAEASLVLVAERERWGGFPADPAALRSLAGDSLPAGEADGYRYSYRAEAGPDGQAEAFVYTAVPVAPGESGSRAFCVDSDGASTSTADGAPPAVRGTRCPR